MAHAHASNVKRIWMVFFILSLVTIVEVILGIIKPDALYLTKVLGTSPLNIIFIVLTLFKAYYIVWTFMHLEGEKKSLRWAIVAPLVFLVIYLVVMLLIEADYVFDVLKNDIIKWHF